MIGICQGQPRPIHALVTLIVTIFSVRPGTMRNNAGQSAVRNDIILLAPCCRCLWMAFNVMAGNDMQGTDGKWWMRPSSFLARLFVSRRSPRSFRFKSSSPHDLFRLKHDIEMSVANIGRLIRDFVSEPVAQRQLYGLLQAKGARFAEDHPDTHCLHVLSDIDGG